MLASDLIENVPTVHRTTSALEAARIVATLRVSGVVVADDAGEPVAVIPGTQLLKLVVPRYVRENAALAHVYDEAAADEISARLSERTVADLLDDDDAVTTHVPEVAPGDTLVEIAAVMVREHSPVVVVRERRGTCTGVVTLARVLAAVLDAAGEAGPAVRRTLDDDLSDVLARQQERDSDA